MESRCSSSNFEMTAGTKSGVPEPKVTSPSHLEFASTGGGHMISKEY